ncbi:MAG: tetratricopeptide repeat protein [Desulfomonile tiedjei]|uniref:Tetratricopeptide repeat protein n=1 Tax=Desulfomonile tiedjei TaxID=2358 RepID=A0A9D6V2K5_9BACT|nr:tetratricopeptide repeat protein [Desulfomonile tiedjei]
MTGNARYISLIVVAGLVILLTAFAVPAPAQSTTEKEDHLLIPESSEPVEATANEVIANEDAEESDDLDAEDDSLVSKGRDKGAQRSLGTQQANSTNSTANTKRTSNKLNKPQNANLGQSSSGGTVTGIKTAPVRTGTAKTGISSKDLSKVSIANQPTSSSIGLAGQSKLTPTSTGGPTTPSSSVSPLVKTALPASGLVGTGVLRPDLGNLVKDKLGGLGKDKQGGAGAGGTTNTQGDVTGGGKGSVTTGGVQSGGGEGSNTQGSTVSTGGGNTVGGVQQSGNNNSVDITQNTTNVTNVTKVGGGGGGGGFFGGGGGGGGEIPSVDVSPIEPEPQPVVFTRTVAAPQDSCPIVVELNQMGFNYYQSGTYTSAEEAFKRALDLIDKQACKDRPLMATTLENLAFTFDKLGKYEDAVKYQGQAQLIRRMQ